MLKLVFSVAVTLLFASPAMAACPGSLLLKDAANVQAPAKYTDDGSGNCQVNTAEQDGANATMGTKADTAWVSGSGSIIAILKAISANLTASVPGGTNTIGFISNDVCSQAAKTNFALSVGTGTVQIVGGSASKKVYLCSIAVFSTGTATINFIEGTGSTCTAANEAAIIGSTTAANGVSLATNGSAFTLGNGFGTVGVTATAANGVCILQSGQTGLAGNVTYVQQ